MFLRWLLVASRLEYFGATDCWLQFFCIGCWNARVFWLGLLMAAGRCTLKLGTGYLVEFLVLELGTKL
jgi:hypothetical protein